MGKFSKKSLPRGVKLYGADTTQTQQDVATAMSNKGIDKDNFKRPSIPWRLTFAPTVLRWETFGVEDAALPFLFTLIPPQELFDANGQQAYDQVELSLEDISVSFDTLQEPAAVSADTVGLLHGFVEAYGELEITILEKQQWHFNQNMNSHLPERVLFTRTLRAEEFSAMDFPIAQTDLGIQLSPYKTYALQVSVPNLKDTSGLPAAQQWNNNQSGLNYVLPSPVFSIKGKWTRLTNTEINTAPGAVDPELQNGPERATSDNNDTVTVTAPVGGTNIEANTLNTNLTALDDKLFERIQGGYGPNSEMGRYGHTLETMGYDIIAVPFFNNSKEVGLRSTPTNPAGENITSGPYFTVGAPNFIYDRFIMPVAFPMEVHHVYCGWSLISPENAVTGNPPGVHPTQVSTKWQVGVSMGSGAKSDWNALSQIAALEFNVNPADPNYYQNYLIDRWRVKDYGDRMGAGGTTDPKWDVALLQVPLMKRVGGSTGPGYYDQGEPIFVGRGNSWTAGNDNTAAAGTIALSRRSNITFWNAVNNPPYLGALHGTPPTKGSENFIEVAVKVEDSAGLENAPANELFTGHGGFWVYLVVKRAGAENVERLR